MNLRAIDPTNDRKGLEGRSRVDQASWDEFFNKAASKLDLVRLDAEYDRLWGNSVRSAKPSEALIEDEEERLAQKPLNWLLEQYSSRTQNVAPKRNSQEATTYDRDPIVVALRKRLADYRCEVADCQSEQFHTASGVLFVEVHHLLPLSRWWTGYLGKHRCGVPHPSSASSPWERPAAHNQPADTKT
jgi:hypothetical protein